MSASTNGSNASNGKNSNATNSSGDMGYYDTMSISSGSTVVNNSRLLTLCLKGDWSILEQVIRPMEKGNPELSIPDEETGVTPLMIAARENKLVIVERLLDLGVNVNDRAKDNRTVIHYAATYAKEDIVKLLINRKADTTSIGGPKDQLAIHMACARSSGALGIVQMLLKASGKDTRLIQDKDGCIPVFLAAEVGNVAVCKECLAQNNEPQVKLQRKDTGDSLLHVSCRRKDVDLTKLFVEYGASVDTQNNEGHTPLHIAAWEGDESLMKYLHQVKANPNITDTIDRSPLHIAAERGHTSVVELLVDKFKANVLARTKDGSTLMHISSECGHPDTALSFLKRGVPLHMPNKAGSICLHAAARKGHTAVVRSLLQKGAVVDARTKDNYTALHIAVQVCKPLVVQTLLGFGALVELKGGASQETPLHIAARIKEGEKCAEMLIKSGADVNSIQENGETAMHIACRYGHLKMIQALLDEGADPCWTSKIGESPLHIAIRHCHWNVADELLRFVETEKSRLDAVMLVNQQNQEGETCVHYAAEITKTMAHSEFEDTDIIKLVLEYDGDTNLQSKLTNETPLHYCARAGNEDVLTEIVKHIGPNKVQVAVNKQARNGWSPLLVASEQGHLGIVKILLKNHARVDVFDEHGKAALHLAAESGHVLVADVLLWHRAFVNAKSKLGVSPLHLASASGFNDLVNLLIQTHGATVDAFSLAKKTPLHMAAENGQMEVCSTLMRMKADANASDEHGQTPLHLAAENDHSDVVKLFLKHKPELVTMANTNGMTCAHIAASKGSVAVIKELMRFNKIVVTTARNKTNNSTSLHLAAGGGHREVVKALLEAGASATDENAEGSTAIHLAARYGHVLILEVLKGHCEYCVPSTKTGLTALHVAAHYGQSDFVREMLTHVNAAVKSQTPEGESGNKDSSESGLTPLHLASQSGHEGLVRLLLNSPGVQADAATTIQGAIPLHLAAQSGHTAVVSLLLSKSTSQLHVKDKKGRAGHHLASANGHYDMVALLLGQGADINSFDKNGWTALHFSSKAGYIKVVSLLVESGASPKFETKEAKSAICYAASSGHTDVVSYLMKKDHNTQHLMEDKNFVFDLMICGKSNKNVTIKEFILVSPAPVDTASKMSKNFLLLATKEKERARDLINAGEFCESMATELMAIAAISNGASSLLKAVDCRGTPFLDVLIENEQKEVVSHPTIQKHLSDVWVGSLKWGTGKIMMLFCAFFFIPPVWLAFSLPLRHRYNKVPIIKFMSYLVSHFYLIGLFVMTVVSPLYPIYESKSLLPHWHEWLLLAWLSGLLVSELTNPGDRAGLGWVKIIIIGISAVGILCHLVAFAFQGNDRFLCIYVRNQFFALALLLCFVQLLDFLSFHHLFGPWAIIIRDLMKDLMRFLVILSAFMMGFTLHITAIYQPVYAPVALDPSKGNGTGDGGAPTITPFDTFGILFFSLFGLVEPENLPSVSRNPLWTLTLVKTVFGTYMLVTLIVLINLLIAMMSDTYQRIQAQSDVEWKFGRAKLIRNMNRTSVTPSPLNLFTKLFTYCKVAYKLKGKVCSAAAQQYVDEEEDLDTGSDSRSLDMINAQGSVGLFKMNRRTTRVSPEGFLRPQSPRGPQTIEDVIDWSIVVDKYLQVQGIKGGSDGNDMQGSDGAK